jgi:peptide/nickel transport system permease protein
MIAYIARRLVQTIPIVLGVAVLVFLLFSTVGEDPVRMALGAHATPETIADLRYRWGLNDPLLVQFATFLRQIVTFDLGESYNTGEKLTTIFRRGAGVSLSLTVPPFLIGILLNVTIALLIAYFRGSWFDHGATALFVGSMSISYLVYIIAFQYLFAFELDWFPISGYERGVASIPYLILPWIIIVVVSAGPDIRVLRTVFLEETRADYVRTALAKGASERIVLFRHVLRNALIPILTQWVSSVPFLILGAFLMERFFSIPGLGDILINAIHTGDRPILMSLTVLMALAYSVFNLITDVLYAYADPRVKLS